MESSCTVHDLVRPWEVFVVPRLHPTVQDCICTVVLRRRTDDGGANSRTTADSVSDPVADGVTNAGADGVTNAVLGAAGPGR